MKHLEEVITSVKPEWGTLRGLFPNFDNRSVVLWFHGEETRENKYGGGTWQHRIVFNSEVVDGNDRVEDRFALSFDGKKLAISRRLESDPSRFEVMVNGRQIWQSEDLFFVYHLNWLANDKLAWEGWYQDKQGNNVPGKSGLSYFLNGEDKTGSLVFEPFSGGSLRVRNSDCRWTVRDDGSTTDLRPACCKSITSCHCHLGESQPEIAQPIVELDEKTQLVRVSFNGQTSEWFDGDDQSLRYSFNQDRTRVGYVGMKYSGITRKIGRWIENKLVRIGEKGGEKIPWWGWPIVLVYNPYTGIIHHWEEASKRYYPVNNGQTWKKGWQAVSDHFFTPDDKMVVTASTGTKQQVVIDEAEGSLFDEICNARYLKDEKCICYLARRGDKIMRVTVR